MSRRLVVVEIRYGYVERLSLQQKVFMVSVGNLYFVSAPATDTICTIQKMNGL
jgi:hypothetical protein